MSELRNRAVFTAAVIDNGTAAVKGGFCGEDAPRCEVPNLAGLPRHPGVSGTILGCKRDNFVGNEAMSNRGVLSLTNPVERGRIVHWAEMEEVWRYTLLNGLQVACEEHPLIMTECPDNSRLEREKTATMLFETFNVPALVHANTSVLALYSTGRSTGLVIESGAGRTHIGPIWEGYNPQHYFQRMDFGGVDVTNRLRELLRQEGYPISTAHDWDVVNTLKETTCYVAADYEKEVPYSKESRSIERLHRLPDGQQIFVNQARFSTPEVLFSPSLLLSPKEAAAHNFSTGWDRMVSETIERCEPSVRSELFGNVVLAGGNTLFPKLDERIQREVSFLAPKGSVAKCVAFANRRYATWLGGSILGSLSTFPCMWVSKNEYDEHGATIVHRKA